MTQSSILKYKYQLSPTLLYANYLHKFGTCIPILAHVSLVFIPTTVTNTYAQRTADLGLNSGASSSCGTCVVTQLLLAAVSSKMELK